MTTPTTPFEDAMRLMLDNKSCSTAVWDKIEADHRGIVQRTAYACQKFGWFKDMALQDTGVLSYVLGFMSDVKTKVLNLVQEEDLQSLINHPDASTMWVAWIEMGLSVGNAQVVETLWYSDACQDVRDNILGDLQVRAQQGESPFWAAWALKSGLVTVAIDMYATLQPMVDPSTQKKSTMVDWMMMGRAHLCEEFYGGMVDACERFLQSGGEYSHKLYLMMQNVGKHISLKNCPILTKSMMEHYVLHLEVGDTTHKPLAKPKMI